MNTFFALPDVGEGLTEADIVSWKVTAGDTVTVNQTLVEIETAKSLVELPSPHSGQVSDVLVAEGDTVEVGTPIIQFSLSESGSASEPAAVGDNDAQTTGAGDAEASGTTLVGYGSREESGARQRRRRPAPARETEPQPAALSSADDNADSPADRRTPTLAKPPVRRLAKDWGIDLRLVTPTGAAGEVTRDDLAAHRSTVVAEASHVTGDVRQRNHGEAPRMPANDDLESRIPVRGVRKATAKAMVESAFTAPHVTEFLDVDVTGTMDYIRRAKQSGEFGDRVKVSPLAVVAKAVCWALARTPEMNSSLDGDSIVVKNYVNLGIAAATDRGLIVPNIKDAQRLGIAGLAAAITELARTARNGATPPAAQSNGTITITNVGMFGVDSGTPIINPGECAILAFGQIRKRPWVVNDELSVREVTTLALSSDHRIVDGAAISTFLADLGRALEEPTVMLS